jgi:hypothetical protein
MYKIIKNSDKLELNQRPKDNHLTLQSSALPAELLSEHNTLLVMHYIILKLSLFGCISAYVVVPDWVEACCIGEVWVRSHPLHSPIFGVRFLKCHVMRLS